MLFLDNVNDGLEPGAGDPGVGDGGFESDVDCLAESSWVRSGLGASFVEF